MLKKITILAVILFSFASPVLSQNTGSPKELPIDSEDRLCSSDADCIGIPTHYGGCSCGESVNQKYQEKYRKEYELFCKDYFGGVCDFYCPRSFPRCVDQHCALTAPDKNKK